MKWSLMVAHKLVMTAINAKSGSERYSKHLSQFYIDFFVGSEMNKRLWESGDGGWLQCKKAPSH